MTFPVDGPEELLAELIEIMSPPKGGWIKTEVRWQRSRWLSPDATGNEKKPSKGWIKTEL